MLGAGRAKQEIARVQAGKLIDTLELPGYWRNRGSIGLRQAVIPEDSPLADKERRIDVFAVTKGMVIPEDAREQPRPYVVGRVAIEHTPGDEPAVVDVIAQPHNEQAVLATALPAILEQAHVRRALLEVDRANVDASTIQDAGYEQQGPDTFLVRAAA